MRNTFILFLGFKIKIYNNFGFHLKDLDWELGVGGYFRIEIHPITQPILLAFFLPKFYFLWHFFPEFYFFWH